VENETAETILLFRVEKIASSKESFRISPDRKSRRGVQHVILPTLIGPYMVTYWKTVNSQYWATIRNPRPEKPPDSKRPTPTERRHILLPRHKAALWKTAILENRLE
jgi:hypothetical protein